MQTPGMKPAKLCLTAHVSYHDAPNQVQWTGHVILEYLEKLRI